MNLSIDTKFIITISVHEFAFIFFIYLAHLVFINVRLIERHSDMQVTLLLVIRDSVNNSLSDYQITLYGDSLVQLITGHMAIYFAPFF